MGIKANSSTSQLTVTVTICHSHMAVLCSLLLTIIPSGVDENVFTAWLPLQLPDQQLHKSTEGICNTLTVSSITRECVLRSDSQTAC